jgi:hypothetical protein
VAQNAHVEVERRHYSRKTKLHRPGT